MATYRYDLIYKKNLLKDGKTVTKEIFYPRVPVILSHNGKRILVYALIDTGATHSLIDGEIACLLDHDLVNKKVIIKQMNTAGNVIKGYEHSFRIQILDLNDDKNVVWDSAEELKIRCSKAKKPLTFSQDSSICKIIFPSIFS